METLETTDQESFQAHFSERTWTVTLSNGTVKELVDDGENTPLLYEDRLKYGKLAREVRMAESDDQVIDYTFVKAIYKPVYFLILLFYLGSTE